MKKIIVLLVSVFAINTFSVYATNNKTTVETQTESDFYTFQFSLNRYTGTIGSSYTCDIRVSLNYPQEKDVYATVYVYIDNECVASKLYKILAGRTTSATDAIYVGGGYNGKKFTLKVQ